MLTISIKKDGHGNLMAEANGKGLCCFDYREECGGWLFWFRGQYDPEIKPGKAFPMTYFKDLCRAIAFLKGEPLADQDQVKIWSGMSYIKRIGG